MFAVPGWDVAAKSLVQEQVKLVKDKSTRPAQRSDVLAENSSANPNWKKRKRDRASEWQGPDAASKHQDFPNNAPSTPQLSNTHKKWHHHPAAGAQTNNSTGSRAKKRKNGGEASGANSEPVGPVRTKAANQTSGSHYRPVRQSVERNLADTKDGAGPAAKPPRSTNNAAAKPAEAVDPPSLPPIPPAPTNLTPLQAKMRAKLTAARFRHLNEALYTTSSTDALELFTNSPDLFAEYHAGFSQQVKDSWPQNPVDVYVKTIKSRASAPSPVGSPAALPRRKTGTCTIADLGCGDAPLAKSLQGVIKKFNLKLYNFDLHAPNDLVTKADISALPLRDGEVDIAIFCLSLMGTNWLSFVEEAWRILRGDGKGEVWVAEVKSRFGRISAKALGKVVENSVGKRRKPQPAKKNQAENAQEETNPIFAEDERDARQPGAEDDTDLQPFIDSFQRRGFILREGSIDKTNKMFVGMVFTKAGIPRAGKWKDMKWNGKEYQRMENKKQRRFQGGQGHFTVEDEIDEQVEGKLLKPCVYKLR